MKKSKSFLVSLPYSSLTSFVPRSGAIMLQHFLLAGWIAKITARECLTLSPKCTPKDNAISDPYSMPSVWRSKCKDKCKSETLKWHLKWMVVSGGEYRWESAYNNILGVYYFPEYSAASVDGVQDHLTYLILIGNWGFCKTQFPFPTICLISIS